MKLSANEKSTIYSYLTKIKECMEYIEFYYNNNFKDSIDYHIGEIKRNSIMPVTDEDVYNQSIWHLMNMLENRVTHNDFIKKAYIYYESLDGIKDWFDKNPLVKCEWQETIDSMQKAFTYSYVTDGIGIDDECFETGIIHLHNNYSDLHGIIEDFIKKISSIKCKRESIFLRLFKKKNGRVGISEDTFINQLVESCFKLQEDKTFFKDSTIKDYDLENKRNRMIRNLLDVKGQEYNYVVKDQTQRGLSKNGNAPGEIDFLIDIRNTNFTIIEALNLDDSFNKKYLKVHEIKLKKQYDKVGNAFNVILVYADVNDLNSFQAEYQKYLKENYNGKITKFETNKTNSFGYAVKINSNQKLYHLVFKIG